MCVIVTKPAGQEISIDTLKQCWDTNKHGAGIAWAIDGKLRIEKGFMSWDSFRSFYGDHTHWKEAAAIFHFRIRTHGDQDEDNTHPFWVIPGQLVFAHNGVMSDMVIKDRKYLSDTQVFNRYILQQLPHNFLSNQGMVRLIDSHLGARNKLAFLDNLGNITHFNKSVGVEWESGVWFSNNNHIKSTSYSTGWKPASQRSYGHGRRYASSGARFGYPASANVTPAKTSGVVTVNPKREDDDVTEYSVKKGGPVIDVDDAPDMDDWYCEDCCIWFDDDNDGWDPFTATWQDTPKCPACGTSDFVGWGYDDKAWEAWAEFQEKRSNSTSSLLG